MSVPFLVPAVLFLAYSDGATIFDAGMPAPVLWGDEDVVRRGLGGGVSDLRLTRVNCRFDYPFAPAEVVEFFREYCGPTTRAFATLEETLERIFSMSRSASLLPSIRVDDPMLSIVAARRKADNRSGASVLSARQAPLNSSSFAMMSSISGSMTRVLVLMVPAINPAISSWYFAGKLKLGVDPRPKGQRGAMY